MARRQLKKVDPHVDLSRWLRTVDQLPELLSSETLFGNKRPLEIEVGSGKGLFIERITGERPEHNFLGIEIAAKYAAAAASRLAKQQRTNGMIISGDAEPLFKTSIPEHSLAAVHVYFPDPWWKAKHKRRRVLNESFIDNVARCLQPDGRFHFWTDVLDYFESTLELLAKRVPEWGPPLPEAANEATHDLDYRTHFERRSRQHAIPVYRVRYELSSQTYFPPADGTTARGKLRKAGASPGYRRSEGGGGGVGAGRSAASNRDCCE
ncbi:MAG: tRNA (guanosine(46)-N7)-methyltransferase TrmB [Pirellulaceae bacterium]